MKYLQTVDQSRIKVFEPPFRNEVRGPPLPNFPKHTVGDFKMSYIMYDVIISSN